MMAAGNSKKQPKRKSTPASFKPGQSGNPSGRPKKTPELLRIEDLAKEHSETAILALVDEATNGKGAPRVAASIAVLDRGWGKAVERVISDNRTTINDRRVQGADEILGRALSRGKDGSDDGMGKTGSVLPAAVHPQPIRH